MVNETRIGPYLIIREIGRGGMATVYLARDARNQVVALKVLPNQFTHDPTFRDRFLRECKTISRLKHPAILPVYDYGETGETPYLVMRYMPGGTLVDRLGRGPLSREETVRILQPIAAALDYAHQQGVVHRDVKPANIYFDEQGNPYLGDFGVVQLAEATRSFTGSAVIGTPSYMSPEQVRGGRKLDGRSDEYALGVLLYEMLSGKAPYQGETPTQQMMKHVLEPVPRLRTDIPQAPPALEAIMMKALAKDPAERYATSSELIEAVRSLTPPPQLTQYGEPTRAYNDKTRAYVPEPPKAANRTVMLMAAAAAVLLCMVLTVSVAGAAYFGLPLMGARTTPTQVVAVVASATTTPLAVPQETAAPLDPLASPTPQPSVTPLPPITDTPTVTPTPTVTNTSPPPTHAPRQANPQAKDDMVTTDQNTPVTINVAGNDSDPDGNLDAGSVTVTRSTRHGQLQPAGIGAFQYTPDPGFAGQDGFTYQVCDTTRLCDQAQVDIQVRAVNRPPQANDDQLSLTENNPLGIPASLLLGNDNDPDGDPLSITGAGNPEHGSLSGDGNSGFTYTPQNNYCGSDRFQYTISDGKGQNGSAFANLAIACVDQQPIFRNVRDHRLDIFKNTRFDMDTPGLLKYAQGLDISRSSVTNYEQPEHGRVTVNPDGSWSYVPDDNYCGQDGFTFIVSDGSNTATIKLGFDVQC